jgi:LmbE family N-acetylglucosaminyl deacetylase
MKKIFALALLALSSIVGRAQTAVSSADIYLGLKKLNVLGSVLYVAAHPDDENTRLLTWLSKDRLYRTGYLSLTRGDGGQNLIGNEQGIALGMIRTQELLAARRIDGAEQFFTRAFDFGFSKNPEETFTKWDRETILADVVWAIRKFRPDVIITRFPTTGEGGHGHHTASAILANEAFKAAGDPSRFPDQLKWVEVWQPKRILWNTFNFGGNNTQREDQFKVEVGGFNPVLGASYGEISADSRSQHKSQGFGVPRSRGAALEYFSTTGGTAPKNDMMEDVDLSWSRVPGGQEIASLINTATAAFDFLQPHKSIPQLAAVYTALQRMPESYWRKVKMEEVARLIAWSSGLFMEATTSVQNAVQGDSLRVNITVNNRNGAPLKWQRLQVEGFDTTLNLTLVANRNVALQRSIYVATEKPVSQPYWLRERMKEGMFTIRDQQLIGQPDITPAYTARFELEVAGSVLAYNLPVHYKYTDPVKGEVIQPVFVVPAATVFASPDLLIFPKGAEKPREFGVQLSANRKLQATADLEIRSAANVIRKADPTLQLERNGSKTYYMTVGTDQVNGRQTDALQSFVHLNEGGKEQEAYLAMTSINYDHIPTIRYFYQDPVQVLHIDLKTSGKRIGYIVGAGDKVPEALEQMGYDVVLLGEKDLLRNSLQQFDAIITGVRAYNTADWLNTYHEKLMNYVEQGGNLIVQYNTSSQIGPVRAKIGPYKFDISRTRVTDEAAAVTFLKPQHPVLNTPNKITADDFKGWVQERSIYHASNTDPQFEKILGMSDPGEQSDGGSLVVAKHGKGYFTYTGLVFFRQLPAGVPGAYRLLANLIALNSKKAF